MEEWKMLLQEKDAPLLFNLLLLKKMNELFEEERKVIRIDFLVRGICEKEVDGLLEDKGLYKTAYISPNVRWGRLLNTDERNVRRVVIAMMDEAKNRKFAVIPENISDSKIMECIRMVHEGSFLVSMEEVDSFLKKMIR
ncbi:hypothetical protein J2S09_004331 [Bacillus fengqiuensis]|nr:hypothetical protein [Bacillus fengqiuensis]